ncbi:hypothetical protein AV530_012057 [Patagioenas fasciata monilis]|uniref:Uncharacterized protein n=1 Tax=Patagioenas fasciata monilis TaxID=372326 RepID=A0A1V4JV43_PATFA|nr:hypothetical protein AV530_012057 [Patagioenas fasciata monilis]
MSCPQERPYSQSSATEQALRSTAASLAVWPRATFQPLEWLKIGSLQLTAQVIRLPLDTQLGTFFSSSSVPSIHYRSLQVSCRKCYRTSKCF